MTFLLNNVLFVNLLFGAVVAEKMETVSPLKFNQAIAGANAELEKAGFAYGKSLAPLFQGKEADVKNVAKNFVNAVSALEKVEKDMKNLSVPASKEARAFYESHQRFLRSQRKMIVRDFAEVLSIAVNPNFDVASKTKQINPILDRVTELEKLSLQDLSKTQQNFAKFYNIRLR